MLACGSRDSNIYVYSMSEGGKFSKLGKCVVSSPSTLLYAQWVDNGYFTSGF